MNFVWIWCDIRDAHHFKVRPSNIQNALSLSSRIRPLSFDDAMTWMKASERLHRQFVRTQLTGNQNRHVPRWLSMEKASVRQPDGVFPYVKRVGKFDIRSADIACFTDDEVQFKTIPLCAKQEVSAVQRPTSGQGNRAVEERINFRFGQTYFNIRQRRGREAHCVWVFHRRVISLFHGCQPILTRQRSCRRIAARTIKF